MNDKTDINEVEEAALTGSAVVVWFCSTIVASEVATTG